MGIPNSVLIVDDESHIRLFVRMILKQLGVTTFNEASNGKDAVNIYTEKHPDLVIMDINMPGMTGLEALVEINQYDPDAIVVMLTGQASRHSIDESGQSGAAQFIRKDAGKEEIASILTELFDEIYED